MPALTVVPVQSADEVECDEPAGSFDTGAVLCPATNEVFFDDPLARDLYDRFGDFVVGYILGGAWSEAAQIALGSPLQGEPRHLIDDCMTGGWAQSIVPAEDGTKPRPGPAIEPGDLDEAIQTALGHRRRGVDRRCVGHRFRADRQLPARCVERAGGLHVADRRLTS